MSTAVAERKPKRRTPRQGSKKNPANRCTALTRAGKPCTRTRKAGMEVCAAHVEGGTAHRPTKFTEEVRKNVLHALRSGVPRETAATYAGISDSALGDYLARGRKALEAGLTDDYSDFLEAVLHAEAGLEVLLLGRAVAGSKDDPKLGLEVAARKWPQRYGRKDAKLVEHSGTVGVEHLLGGRHPFQVSPDARDRIVAILEEENPTVIDASSEEE